MIRRWLSLQLRILRVIFFAVVLSSILVLIFEVNVNKIIDGYKLNYFAHSSHNISCECTATHKSVVDSFYKKRKTWRLSKVGEILYKNEYPKISQEKNQRIFLILVWKFYKKIANRHILWFGEVWHDPLSGCSVNNCKFTGNQDKMNSADAVIVHLHRGQIPSLENRNPRQKWIFLNDESPHAVFSLAASNNITPVAISDLHNVFNWSMMYRTDADVPVPYGRTVALKVPKYSSLDPPIAKLVPYWKRKKRLIAIIMSNCNFKSRVDIVENLRKYVHVDFFGRCGDVDYSRICRGHFGKDCKILANYMFYLVLESASCKEYLTEKVFHNAYSKGAIPIIRGPSIEDCEKLLPPYSFLHLDRYASIKDLADDLERISNDTDEVLRYHKWRNHFEVSNEHGYFGTKSYHFCRACEAMNYNDDSESIYSEEKMRQFIDKNVSCHPQYHHHS